MLYSQKIATLTNTLTQKLTEQEIRDLLDILGDKATDTFLFENLYIRCHVCSELIRKYPKFRFRVIFDRDYLKIVTLAKDEKHTVAFTKDFFEQIKRTIPDYVHREFRRLGINLDNYA